MKNNLIKSLFLSSIAITMLGCKDHQNKYVAPPPPKVSIMKPIIKNITEYAIYPGYTQSTEVVQLKARVAGFLEEVKFVPSQKVKKGDLLFVIEKTQYVAAVNKAKANLDKAKANLSLAEATLMRKRSAFADQAVSELDVLDAEANVAVAKAAIIQANAQLVDDELNLSYTEVKSPIDGVIDRNLIDVGNLVGPNENSLLAT
ncbi:MAG: efflux RND transporter periplasmic adaptor subunit, partial [Lentisphaeria bacterium]